MRGWIHGLIAVSLWGIANVYHAFASSQVEINSVLFICITFIAASFVLVSYGNEGGLGKNTFKSPSTWSYGLVLIISYIIGMSFYELVTATEGALMRRISVVLSLILAFVAFGRSIENQVKIGALVVLSGVAMIIYNLDESIRLSATLHVLAIAFLQTLQVFISEKHPQSNQAKTVKQECLVIGLVLFAVSNMFLILLGVFYYLSATGLVVQVDILQNLKLALIMGCIYGAIIIAPSKYLEFSSTKQIRGENFLALAALTPAITFFFEEIVITLHPSMEISRISTVDGIAACIITVGALYIAYQRIKGDLEEYFVIKSINENKYKNYFDFTSSPEYLEKKAAEAEVIRLKKEIKKIKSETLLKEKEAEKELAIKDAFKASLKLQLLSYPLNSRSKFNSLMDEIESLGDDKVSDALKTEAELMSKLITIQEAEYEAFVDDVVNQDMHEDTMHEKAKEFLKSLTLDVWSIDPEKLENDCV